MKKTLQTTMMKRKVTKSTVETYVSSLQKTAEAMVLKAATAIGLTTVGAKLLAAAMARLLG
jgi:hypothetical protein